jgi:hypothetical protein
MRSVPVVRMALAGLAMFALACAEKESAPPVESGSAPPAASESAAPAKTEAALMQVKPVKVVISGVACGHRVDPRSHDLDVSNQDELEWEIKNTTCASDQKVLICMYKGATLFNPLFTCRSRPTGGLDIGTTFTVKRAQQETLNCRAKVDGDYSSLVLVGSEVPASGCPGAAPLAPRTDVVLSHMLDIEIFP